MPQIKQIAYRFLPVLKNGGWVAIAASSLFCAVCAGLVQGRAQGLSFSDLQIAAQVNWIVFFGVAAAAASVQLLICRVFENQRFLAAALPASIFCFAMFVANDAPSNIFFSLGLCLPLFFALRWALQKQRNPFGQPNIPMWATHAFALLLFFAFSIIMAYYCILRLRSYNATNFDLGIFAQMFEYLRSTGRMLTTLERNRLLTHFGVHVSPIYYFVLPIYMLFPRIETLLIVQAFAVGAGVFAVRGIAEHLFGKSPRLVMLCCMLFIFNPAFSSGLFFDFHENKFLTVLILYAVLFMLKQKAVPLLIFSGLALMVKEDAAIYVIALAMFLLIAQRWDKNREKLRVATSGVMLACSLLWFIICLAIISHYGDGAMVDRLNNYFIPGSESHGFGEVMRVMLSNLGYVIQQVFVREKMEVMLWLFLPLGFLPFLRKKGADWLLLLPALVINFLSNYVYQYRIGFQYTYGSFALAIVLAMLALRDCSRRLRQGMLLFAVMASMLVTIPLVTPRMIFYTEVIRINADRIAAVDEVVASLPWDTKITATTWFAVHLYQRPWVYMFPNFYAPSEVTEYLVCKPEEAENHEALREFIQAHYELKEEVAFIRVYVRREN